MPDQKTAVILRGRLRVFSGKVLCKIRSVLLKMQRAVAGQFAPGSLSKTSPKRPGQTARIRQLQRATIKPDAALKILKSHLKDPAVARTKHFSNSARSSEILDLFDRIINSIEAANPAQDDLSRLVALVLESNSPVGMELALLAVIASEKKFDTWYCETAGYAELLEKAPILTVERLRRAHRLGLVDLKRSLAETCAEPSAAKLVDMMEWVWAVLHFSHGGPSTALALELYETSWRSAIPADLRTYGHQLILALGKLGDEALVRNADLLDLVDTGNVAFRVARASLLLSMGQPQRTEEALKELRAVVAEEPLNKTALRLLGYQSQTNEHLPDAELYFGRLFWIERNVKIGHLYLKSLLRRKKYKQAAALEQELHAKQPVVRGPATAAFEQFWAIATTTPYRGESLAENAPRSLECCDQLLEIINAAQPCDIEDLSSMQPVFQTLRDRSMRVRRVYHQSGVPVWDMHGYVDGEFFSLIEAKCALLLAATQKKILELYVDLPSIRYDFFVPARLSEAVISHTQHGDLSSAQQILDSMTARFADEDWIHDIREKLQFQISAKTPNPLEARNSKRITMVEQSTFFAETKLPVRTTEAAPESGEYLFNNLGSIERRHFSSEPWIIREVAGRVTLLDAEIVVMDGRLIKPEWFHVLHYPVATTSLQMANDVEAVYRATIPRVVDTPVIVLHNNDIARVKNYFHQLILTLSRVTWFMKEHGGLGGRKLVVPAQTSARFLEALAMVGVAASDLYLAEDGSEIEFKDAVLVSSVQHLSADAIKRLRESLWAAAGVDPTAEPTRKLLVMRDAQGDRRCFEEPEIRKKAFAKGYEEVWPERMSLQDQITTFAGASAVVGLCGGSFTNLAFCHDGIPIVAISKRELYGPTFVEMALSLGQKYRWLLGSNMQTQMIAGIVNCAYHLNPTDIEDALAWSEEEIAAGRS